MASSKDKIIEAALDLFFKEGYYAVGMNKICDAAGVNKSTLYHFFPSKLDLVLSVLTMYSDDINKQFRKISKSSDSPHDKLIEVFETPFKANLLSVEQTGKVSGCFVGNMALELSSREERVRKFLVFTFESWADAISPIIADLATSADVLNVREVSQSVIAYLQGVILTAKLNNDATIIARHAKFAEALIP